MMSAEGFCNMSSKSTSMSLRAQATSVELVRQHQLSSRPMPTEDGDDINHPAHYTSGGMEVWDILKAKLTSEQYYGFMYGNALKYLFRHQLKGSGIKDLEKAKVYTEKCKQILQDRADEGRTSSEIVLRNYDKIHAVFDFTNPNQCPCPSCEYRRSNADQRRE